MMFVEGKRLEGDLQRTKFFLQKPKVSEDSGKLCFPRVETSENFQFSAENRRLFSSVNILSAEQE
ncbi:MAG: hypothetical protein HYU56_05715 [Candidatus Aenigmarchaeota archaeon]|nr:hypothetical protein [Candidatus Aenigmarchaeota archaeon]